jgi:cysteine synthase
MTHPAGKTQSLGIDPQRRRYTDVRQLIAGPDNPTPLVRLNRVNSNPAFELFVKLEWYNPFGSINDRTACYLLQGMLERGELEGKDRDGVIVKALAAIFCGSSQTRML